MTVTGVTDYVIPAILRHHLHCNCASIAPFGLPGPATLMGVIGCASACACAFACACIWPWASWAPDPPSQNKACCCGATAGVVLGLFGRLFQGIASEICCLWVPAVGVAVAVIAVGAGSTLANT
jgi:hypothetical protein